MTPHARTPLPPLASTDACLDDLLACTSNVAGLTQRLLRLADELDLADFVELINGDKEAPTRPVSHDMLVQETLLRYTGEIPEVRTASSASSGFAQVLKEARCADHGQAGEAVSHSAVS